MAWVRIAIVTTSFPAWEGDPAGHFVQTEARALARGAEVVVITARAGTSRASSALAWPPSRPPPDNPGAGALRSSGRGGTCESSPRIVGARSEGGHDPRVIALDGGEAFGWPGVAARVRERPLRALGAMVWVRRARTVLENLGPLDRVVAHWALPCAWPIATGLGTAIAIVSHGADVRALRRLPRVVRSRIVGSLLEQTSEWRFVSEALLAELVRVLSPSDAGALRRVARVEPCAIDMPDVGAAIAGRRSAFAGKALYSCVGRLVESKRVDRVIEHVATLEPSTLVVVGDGPERGNLERLAVTRGVDARFVGKTSRPEALAWIGASDALLHASREEGLSTVVREAEALGVRVVMLAALVLVCAWVALGCS